MALLSVTGSNLEEAKVSEWVRELTTLRKILTKYGKINPDDILGIRAPAKRPGGNNQFKALIESGFVWDSSLATKRLDDPVWPYTVKLLIIILYRT